MKNPVDHPSLFESESLPVGNATAQPAPPAARRTGAKVDAVAPKRRMNRKRTLLIKRTAIEKSKMTIVGLQLLFATVTDQGASDRMRRAAAASVIAFYTGVSYQEQSNLSLNTDDGWLLYKGYPFLPFIEDSAAHFVEQAIENGSADKGDVHLVDALLKVFTLTEQIIEPFKTALSLVKDGAPSPESIRDVLRYAGVPQRVDLPRLSFLARVNRMQASLEFCSMCFLPSERPSPFNCGKTLLPRSLFGGNVLPAEALGVDLP